MTKRPRLAINGFGRIGRAITKLNMKYQKFDLVLINDINPNCDNLVYLLNYDSTYGRLSQPVISSGNKMLFGENHVTVTSVSDLQEISWDSLDIDVLIDSSGVSGNVAVAKDLTKRQAVRKAVVTHSSNDVDREIILGVNTDALRSDDAVVSSSICDANAIAHPLKWINDEFDIVGGSVTTLHPWLSYQNFVDGPYMSKQSPGSGE